MPFNLLLLPLIGGVILLSHWNLTLYFAKRLDKERLLLYSSFVGAILLCLSFGISILVISHPSWIGFSYLLELREWWAYKTPAVQYSGITTLSLILGAGSPWFLNRFWPLRLLWTKEKRGEKATEGYGSPLEQLLLKALKERKYVMITSSIQSDHPVKGLHKTLWKSRPYVRKPYHSSGCIQVVRAVTMIGLTQESQS